MTTMLDENIIRSGKALRLWNGGMKRRRFQVGHVFKRGKRTPMWIARWVEPELVEGKLRRALRSKAVGPVSKLSKGDAQRILADWLKPLNEGWFSPVASASFAEFYEKWERDYLPTFRDSTRAFYRQTARRFVRPYFEDYRLADIRPEHIQQFINLFSASYARSTIKHVRATLRCVFGAAVDWKYLRENPTLKIRLPQGRGVVRASVLEPRQIGQLIERLEEPYRTMVLLAATTGMRESELFGLKWGDFDWSKPSVLIQRRMYRRRVGEPKTQGSRREIPLQRDVARTVLALPRSGEYLFTGPKGGFVKPDELLAEGVRPHARALGLPEITWRTFRRSAESAMHNSGVPMKVQQAMLGHTNPNTTLLYAEADVQGKRSAADSLASVMFPNLSRIAKRVASESFN